MKLSSKLNNIQVLRAFAAVVVVFFHTGYIFPHMYAFGSFGVDIFFVISGYIMARILDPKNHSGKEFFLRRRLIRIVPLYWFCTLALYLISMRTQQLMSSNKADLSYLLESLFFIPFARGNGEIHPILFVGWSLNFEMFFYVALAIGILVHRRILPRIQPVWLGAALVIITMIACFPFRTGVPAAAFYSRDVVLEFPLGILSYYACSLVSDSTARRLRVPALAISVASAAGLIMIQGVFRLYSGTLPFERILVLGIPAFILITSVSLLSQGGWDTRLAWLVLLGDASYILYLIHIYIEFSISRILGPRYQWLQTTNGFGALVGVSLSIAFALLIHVYCERPATRYLNRKFGGRRNSVEFVTQAAR